MANIKKLVTKLKPPTHRCLMVFLTLHIIVLSLYSPINVVAQTSSQVGQVSQVAAKVLTVAPEALRIPLEPGWAKDITLSILVMAPNVTEVKCIVLVSDHPIDEMGAPLDGEVTIVSKRFEIYMENGFGFYELDVKVKVGFEATAGTYVGKITLITPIETEEVRLTVIVRAPMRYALVAVFIGVLMSFFWSVLKFRPPSAEEAKTRRALAWRATKEYLPYLIAALIVSATIFPTFFERFPDFGKKGLLDYCLAFTFGFFWESLIEKTKKIISS